MPSSEMDVIELQQVGVRYREQRTRSLKQAAIHGLTRRSEGGWFHSLRDVSLRIRGGEAVGIVGSNGAGKSTLLRVAAGIIPPSQGTVITRGRVAPLIELGTGFEPEFSGRENILFNGALLGCSRRHMLARMPRIIEFSGLEAFIEQPLRTYSTGMVARLALAIAAATDAETLLLDEVLAVGDSGFRRQCAERLHQFVAEGVTVVLVSHELDVIEALCSRVLWLRAGELVADGPAAEVLQRYREASAGEG